jgi:hypothetical protein
MKNTKMLVTVALLVLGGAVSASAQTYGEESRYGKPVSNPSGGLIGQPQNFPTEGTYSFQASRTFGGYSKPVSNPSGGLIGQPQNFATPGTYRQ